MFNLYNQQQNTPVTPPKHEDLPKADFRKYEDPSGDFDNKELSYSMWWVSHKVLLYRILMIVLIGINVILWGTSLGKWGAYIFGITDQNITEMNLSRFNNYTYLHEHFQPKPLQIGATNIFSGGVKKVDAVAEITNPNEKFTVTFSYFFVANGTTTPLQEATILAGQSGLAAVLGIPEEIATGGSFALQIQNVRWTRISAHKIPNPITWQNERLNFKVSNFVFNTPFSNAELKTNQLAFTLKNESAYAYKQPSFFVGLYSQGALVGVLPLQLPDMYSGTESQVDIRSFSSNMQVSEVAIFPLINIYDKTVFLPPKAN